VHNPAAPEQNEVSRTQLACHTRQVKAALLTIFGCLFAFYLIQGCWHSVFGGGEPQAHSVEVCWSGGDGTSVNDEPIRAGVPRTGFLTDDDLSGTQNPEAGYISDAESGCWSVEVPAGREVEFSVDRSGWSSVECTTRADGSVVEQNRVTGDDVRQEVRCSGP
jgi:hypothetical protein